METKAIEKEIKSSVIHLNETKFFNRINGTDLFNKGGFNGNIYIGENEKELFTICRIEVDGENSFKEIKGITRTYFVISGKGIFEIDGKKTDVLENDLLIIRSGQKYKYKGKMTLLETNIFDC